WLDFELWRAWQDVQSVGFASSLDVPGAWVGGAWVGEPGRGGPPPHAGMAFGYASAAALHQHIQLLATPAGRATYPASAPFVAALGQLRTALRRSPALLEW